MNAIDLLIDDHEKVKDILTRMTESTERAVKTRAELLQKVEQAQLKVVRCTSFVSLLFPLLLISRIRRRGKEYDSHAEYRVSRIVNKLLEFALTVERAAIRLGATLPFGGSLLLVAHREGAGTP